MTKEIKAYLSNIDRKYFIIAIIHVLITFFSDQLVFTYIEKITSEKLLLTLFFYKIILTFILIIAWQKLAQIIKLVKHNDIITKKQLGVFLLYFIIMLLPLLFTWPGLWRWDEYHTMGISRSLSLDYWQHYMSSVYNILAMMILPFPSGIIIVQLFLISYIISFLFIKFYIFLDKSNFAYLIIIPFLSFAVIDTNLYTIRATIYAYILLFTITFILSKYYSKTKITIIQSVGIAFLTGVLSVWRSESIIFIILIPLLFIFCFSFQKNRSVKIHYLFFVIIFTLALYLPQYYGINKSDKGDRYQITALIQPISLIVKETYNNPTYIDTECFDKIDKIIDIEKLYLSEGDGIHAFWCDDICKNQSDYNREEFNEFKFASLKLIYENFDIFIKERIKTFITTSAMSKSSIIHIRVFDNILELDHYREAFFNNFIFSKPINSSIRIKTIMFLEGRSGIEEQSPNIIFHLFYNILFSVVGVLSILIISIYRKKYEIFIVSCILLSQALFVFLTAPASFFFYYLPIYICGNALIFGYIIIFLNKIHLSKHKIVKR